MIAAAKGPDVSFDRDVEPCPDVSVVICSHNPSRVYLRRTLEALAAQTLGKHRWELLVIDNASDAPLAAAWDLSWHPRAKHIFEGELGLSAARLRAMKEAAADLLVFVDDDNVLDPNYLAEALRIGGEWPRLGVWGSGAITPEFETPPSAYVTKIVPYLALREVPRARWSNFPSLEATPWGAGLCIRRSVAEAYARSVLQSSVAISGRRGAALMSGEDLDLSYVACDIGFGIGIFPELKLTHLIPSRRVEKDYLLRLVEGAYVSNALLAYKWTGTRPRSASRPIALLSTVKNLLRLRGIDRETYLAGLRAAAKARRLIDAAETATAKTTISPRSRELVSGR